MKANEKTIKKLDLHRETLKKLGVATGVRAGDTSSHSAECSGPPDRSGNTKLIGIGGDIITN